MVPSDNFCQGKGFVASFLKNRSHPTDQCVSFYNDQHPVRFNHNPSQSYTNMTKSERDLSYNCDDITKPTPTTTTTTTAITTTTTTISTGWYKI